MNNNKKVLDFLHLVEDKKGYVTSNAEKALLRTYENCSDMQVSQHLIKKVWDFFIKEFIELKNFYSGFNQITIFDANAGIGKLYEDCPNNMTVKAYTRDYNCQKIFSLLNARIGTDFSFTSEVNDISHYFIGGDEGSIMKYDIVFNTIDENNNYYLGLDDTKLANYSPSQYYSSRSLDFVTKGGYLCVFANKDIFDNIKRTPEVKNTTNLVDEIIDGNNFGCLIFKKQ